MRKMLLIDGNTKLFPAYLQNLAKIKEPLELLYTDTVAAGLKQIEKGDISLVLLAKPYFSSKTQIEALNPQVKIIAIDGPKDKVFLDLENLECALTPLHLEDC